MNDLKLKISKNTFGVWLYSALLLLPFIITSFEINVIISLIILFIVLFFETFKISQNLFISSSILLLILGLSFFSQFLYYNLLYDIVKDAFYLIKPFIYLCLGYFLASKIKNKDDVFKIVIYLGILLALIHVFKVLFFLIETQNYQINKIRFVGGKDNFLELLACSLLVLNKNKRYFEIDIKYKKTVYLLLTLSFVFYFSRTMMVTFFIFMLSVNGYLKLSKKSIVAVLSLTVATLLFYKLLFSYDIQRGAQGFEGFLYKIKIAPSEIFSSDINLKDPTERWDHWRAYEAKKAFETMNEEGGVPSYFIGMGLGSLIDLGFKADLGKEKMQYIPKIHNGYVYIIFKAGIIGLVFYLLFLLNLYLKTYIVCDRHKVKFINNFISAIAIFYLFTSFIISGVYNPKDVFTIFLGALLSLQVYYKKV